MAISAIHCPGSVPGNDFKKIHSHPCIFSLYCADERCAYEIPGREKHVEGLFRVPVGRTGASCAESGVLGCLGFRLNLTVRSSASNSREPSPTTRGPGARNRRESRHSCSGKSRHVKACHSADSGTEAASGRHSEIACSSERTEVRTRQEQQRHAFGKRY